MWAPKAWCRCEDRGTIDKNCLVMSSVSHGHLTQTVRCEEQHLYLSHFINPIPVLCDVCAHPKPLSPSTTVFWNRRCLTWAVGILCVLLFNSVKMIPLVRNCAQIRSVNVWCHSVQSYKSKLAALWTQHWQGIVNVTTLISFAEFDKGA